jgi:tRNA threonylcarbamoyladenosine biosynthesis protein TsaB
MCEQMGWPAARAEAVLFSQGPGSFTGLRVAATVARMFQWSIGCDVVAVPTLEVIAANVQHSPERPRIAVMVNAGRGQVFGALYQIDEGDRPRALDDVAVRDPAVWPATIARPFRVLGEAVGQHREACERSGGEVLDESLWRPTARQVVRLGYARLLEGRTCAPEDVRPLYVRRPEAEEVYEQRRAAARARRGE